MAVLCGQNTHAKYFFGLSITDFSKSHGFLQEILRDNLFLLKNSSKGSQTSLILPILLSEIRAYFTS